MASRKALYQAGGVATRSRTSSSSPFRMPVSGGLPTLRWGGRGFRRVPISSISEPGPLAVPGPLAGPHPLLAVVHPALPDQRRHQPVPVHREVVPEPALHAGGALVRGGLLDPGRRHPHDLVALHLQIDLAADAAVGADRARHLVRRADRLGAEPLLGDELEDRARGADPDALAAPGAAGVVGIAVAADDDLGVLAPHADIEHPDLLDVLAGPHAAGAEDTGAHVVLDHDVAGTLVAGAERKLVVVADRDVVLGDVALELVAGPTATPVLQVLARVALQQEAEHRPAILHGGLGLRLHHHPFGRRGGAGREELP